MIAPRRVPTEVVTVSHRCKQTRVLALCGAGLVIALGWLFNTVYGAELERREMRTKLERMSEDISAIRAVIEDASRRGRVP